MRTVLVTGGAGFIGSHLVDRLLEGGAAVRVLDNLSTGSLTNLRAAADDRERWTGFPNNSRLEVMIGDVRDRDLLRTALRGVKYVFHLASLPESSAPVIGPGEIHAVNVDGTLNVLHAALTEGVWRVIAASCATVYGTPTALPISEEAPLSPTTLFAASKVAAETYCRAFHARHRLDTVVLRLFSVYGPRQRALALDSPVPSLIEAVRRGRAFVDVDDRSASDFIYVDDVVDALLTAARAPRATGRVINVGSGEMLSIGELQRITADLLKTSVVPGYAKNRDSQPVQLCARTTVASEVLDFTPRVSVIAGMARVLRSLADDDEPEHRALAQAVRDE
jgi:nucleoside-diphosphate-sugar epimerase